MACASCGFENRGGTRFCVECGAPLSRQCPSCEAPVEDSQRFCGECGTALTSTPPSAAPAPSPDAVRKTVTVLFADLGGSTGFGERTDAEISRRVLADYHALLQETIDAHMVDPGRRTSRVAGAFRHVKFGHVTWPAF